MGEIIKVLLVWGSEKFYGAKAQRAEKTSKMNALQEGETNDTEEGGREETMTNPDKYESQQDPNTYFINPPDSFDKSLNMQIAQYLFKWQITPPINRVLKHSKQTSA